MPKTEFKLVKSLHLDLRNFRTVPQPDEAHAISAVISTNPDWFWALMESLLDDGYHPTENIIVLETDGKLHVKEGNRRIAALKLVFSSSDDIDVPSHLTAMIKAISPKWKQQNSKVPCAIYANDEKATVDKLVARTHAKGEKAGRDQWNAVARARYARDQQRNAEPGLDLLENYLRNGKNLSQQQAERWAGEYPLTVLNEALQKLAPHMGLPSATELAQRYPGKNKRVMDKVLYDIGIDDLGFKTIRNREKFFGARYGIAMPAESSVGTSSQPVTQASPSQAHSSTVITGTGHPAFASTDPRSVRRLLRAFQPKGGGREKLVTLLAEAMNMKIQECPHAFCFVLRSMFELSAKAYCADHKATSGLSAVKAGGEDKHLVDVLREITKHLTNNGQDRDKSKRLHGAMTELAKKDGLLSVTSMNQLIHNPSFSVSPPDICLLFGNVFPLLEEMNS